MSYYGKRNSAFENWPRLHSLVLIAVIGCVFEYIVSESESGTLALNNGVLVMVFDQIREEARVIKQVCHRWYELVKIAVISKGKLYRTKEKYDCRTYMQYINCYDLTEMSVNMSLYGTLNQFKRLMIKVFNNPLLSRTALFCWRM